MVNTALIKAKRLQLGLTMDAAAKLAGFPGRGRWNQIENGARADPRVSTLYGVSQALGCTIEDLLLPQKSRRLK